MSVRRVASGILMAASSHAYLIDNLDTRGNKTIVTTYSVLMFAPLFAPTGNPEAIVNNKLALAFMAEGWSVQVISRADIGDGAYRYGEVWEQVWAPLRRVTIPAFGSRAAPDRSPVRFGRPARALSNLASKLPVDGARWAIEAAKIGMGVVRKRPFDVILTRSGSAMSHVPGLCLSRRTGHPWIANFNDPTLYMYPNAWRTPGTMLLGCVERALNWEVARRSSALTFPSERLRRYVCKTMPRRSSSKSMVIPHVALRGPRPPKAERDETFTLTHLGKLGADRSARTFLNAVRAFVSKRRCRGPVALNLFGLIDESTREWVTQNQLESVVRFRGPITYTEALSEAERSDVLVVIESPYDEGIYLPSKFVDYAQVGRPILAVSPRDGTVSDYLRRVGGGIAADCRSTESIIRALEDMYDAWLKGSISLEYDVHRLYDQFSPRVVVDAYRELFERLRVAPGARRAAFR